MIPQGSQHVEDYIIHAATEFCAWVSRQRLDDVSNTCWSLLAADHYREARALLLRKVAALLIQLAHVSGAQKQGGLGSRKPYS